MATPKSKSSSVSQTSTGRQILQILLPLFSIIGAYGTWVLGSSNGTFKGLTELLAQKSALLPGTKDALIRTYTRIRPIDEQLQLLVAFFAPVVDSTSHELSLFSTSGSGQFGGAWTLLLLESLRNGNKGKAISYSYIGIVGLLFQNLTYTVTIPVYLTLHLLTSPVANSSQGKGSNVFQIPTLDLKLLPISVTLGYIVPTILMALPSPEIVSPVTHQKLIAFWQPFPVWTVVAHSSLRYILGKVSPQMIINAALNSPGTTYLNAAKYVYIFVLAQCSITHIYTLIIAALPGEFASKLLPGFAPTFNGKWVDVFIPYTPLPSHKVPDLAAGVLTFLHWDFYVGSTAFLLWAAYLYQDMKAEKINANPGRGALVVKTLGWILVSGPIGAVAALLWERDSILVQKLKR